MFEYKLTENARLNQTITEYQNPLVEHSVIESDGYGETLPCVHRFVHLHTAFQNSTLWKSCLPTLTIQVALSIQYCSASMAVQTPKWYTHVLNAIGIPSLPVLSSILSWSLTAEERAVRVEDCEIRLRVTWAIGRRRIKSKRQGLYFLCSSQVHRTDICDARVWATKPYVDTKKIGIWGWVCAARLTFSS